MQAPLSDAELLDSIRNGDREAFAQLWKRHDAAGLRYARMLTRRRHDAEELVSEAATKILATLLAGGGPQTAFRTYLLSTIRRASIDLGRSYTSRVTLAGDEELEAQPSATPAAAADDAVLDRYEHRVVWGAWKSLDDNHRMLLWHSIVEQESPAQIAVHLGTSANVVSVRLTRAKERLRQAYLQGHIASAESQNCQWTRARLGGYVRDTLARSTRSGVDDHLGSCADCSKVLLELHDVTPALKATVPSAVLGVAIAPHYLAHHGLSPFLVRVRHPSGTHSAKVTAASAAAAAAAVIAAVAASAMIATQGPAAHGRPQAQDQPAAQVANQESAGGSGSGARPGSAGSAGGTRGAPSASQPSGAGSSAQPAGRPRNGAAGATPHQPGASTDAGTNPRTAPTSAASPSGSTSPPPSRSPTRSSSGQSSNGSGSTSPSGSPSSTSSTAPPPTSPSTPASSTNSTSPSEPPSSQTGTPTCGRWHRGGRCTCRPSAGSCVRNGGNGSSSGAAPSSSATSSTVADQPAGGMGNAISSLSA